MLCFLLIKKQANTHTYTITKNARNGREER
jgi:hypothetical protein